MNPTTPEVLTRNPAVGQTPAAEDPSAPKSPVAESTPQPEQPSRRIEQDDFGARYEVVVDDLGEVCFGLEATELGKRSVLAFRRNLRDLMARYPATKKGPFWAAYYGDELVGVSQDPTNLSKLCRGRGILPCDSEIRPIEPLPVDDLDIG